MKNAIGGRCGEEVADGYLGTGGILQKKGKRRKAACWNKRHKADEMGQKKWEAKESKAH